MENLVDFYKGKRVLVTGYTGFKGTWLTMMLQHMGADVVGLGLSPTTTPNMFNLCRQQHVIVSIMDLAKNWLGPLQKMAGGLDKDIRSAPKVKEALTLSDPEIVFHLAAQPLVSKGYDDPVYTYDVNVMGTANLLNCISTNSKTKVKSIVVVTTDKVYQDYQNPCEENDKLDGPDPYSNSKSCTELVVNTWRRSYFDDMKIGIATARSGNVIGGGDWAPNRLIPDIVRAYNRSEPFKIRKPNAIRPWIYVLDTLYGYLLLAKKMHTGKFTGVTTSVNFAGEDTVTAGEIARYIKRVHLKSLKIVEEPTGLKEVDILKLDTTRAKIILGWKPISSCYSAIDMAMYWYQNYYGGNECRKYTESVIENYLALINQKK